MFLAFLPKPVVMLDDQAVETWRRLLQVHPNAADGQTFEGYRARLQRTQ